MATRAQVDGDRAMSVGRVFSRAFAAVAADPATMFGIAFLFGALPGLVWTLVSQPLRLSSLGAATPPVDLGTELGIGLVVLLAYVACALVMVGALVRATVDYDANRRTGFGAAVATGFAVAFPLLVLSILFGLAVMLASVLLFVPGVMLAIMWSVAAPALIVERRGVIGTFGRSRYLTRGARWKIFGLGLVAFVLYVAVLGTVGTMTFASYGAAGLVAATRTGLTAWSALVSAIVQTVVGALWAALQASLYVELRDWKDGPATDRLAEIFA